MKPITDYIPHRSPFIMVSGTKFAGNEHLSQLVVNSDNLFFEDGHLNEAGLLEHMAQSVAVINAAAMESYDNNQSAPPPVGYIGAVKNFIVNRLPRIDEIIESRMTILHQIMNAQIVEMRAFVNEEQIACCELKIFVSN